MGADALPRAWLTVPASTGDDHLDVRPTVASRSPYRATETAAPTSASHAVLLARWRGRYCEAFFEELAQEDHPELGRIISDGLLTPGGLSLAAEAMGRGRDRGRTERVLLPLLRHRSPMVREGAIQGLSAGPISDEALEQLRVTASNDPSPAVREAAAEALEQA